MSQARRAYEALPHPQVVVVGGGFAGLELIKRLEGAPYKVLLLDKHNHHCFQPLLYQVATASLSADSIAHPFRRTVAPMPNVAFRMTRVLAVKPQEKRVVTDHGEFAYDILVLATGSTTNFFGNDQLEREAMQLKSIGQALDIRSDFLQDFEAALYAQDEAGQRRCLNFTIVGGGPTGVELAGALAEIRRTVLKREYRELDSDRMQIWLVDSNERVLKNFSEKASANALKYLEDMGVNVKFGARVTGYDGEVVSFKDGTSMDSNTLIWAAGVKGVTLPGLEAAEVPQANRYHVDRFSRLQGVPDVFALGDVALMAEGTWERGHPQVATAAIQQARLLADNLIRKAKGGPMEAFMYKDKGSMATIGRYKAVVDVGRFHMGGLIAWLAWMFVHLMALVGYRNRLQVLMAWAWKYLSWKNTIRLIIRPYIRSSAQQVVEAPQG
ncbi:MAG: NAD(P)/FAD-dependent oxidoreductase [Flavobacteriales bacterium]|nr:NAD(P)/FAD-dependent oxidoreductase [Flavobacteriales bacterium]MBK7941704.1 NAD(P)/FAD-dependent oxidoreductase [Flavobacteriales bacterium]MBK8949270.1 NAD(P)/FAD-dependent oxidoreductase [Flavobacteriales bacterium]